MGSEWPEWGRNGQNRVGNGHDGVGNGQNRVGNGHDGVGMTMMGSGMAIIGLEWPK